MSFGNIPPFFTSIGPAGPNNAGFLTTGAQTIAGNKTFSGTTDAALRSTTGATTATALTETTIGTTDTGTNPLAVRNYRIGASTAVVTRPFWQDQNNGTALLSLIPINSGADSALIFRVNGAAAPALSATRTAGERIIISDKADSTHADFAVGMQSGSSMYIGIDQASVNSSLRLYAGATNTAIWYGDGRAQHNGGRIEKTRVALTTPVTVAVTDWYVESNLTTPGAVAMNLPATPTTGTVFLLKDGKGDGASNNITITPAAGNIDGAATKVINTAYGAVRLIYNGTQWTTF